MDHIIYCQGKKLFENDPKGRVGDKVEHDWSVVPLIQLF